MVASKDMNYELLVNRKVAILASFLGMLQLLVATFTIICAFIMLGAFCENLSCEHTSTGLGFWVGFPLLIPAILGLVVLGTRHKVAVFVFLVANLMLLGLSIAHIFITLKDYDDTWEDQMKMYDSKSCSLQGPKKCLCNTTLYGYPCDLIEFGRDLNWVLFGASIASAVFSLFGLFIGLAGVLMRSKARK